MPALRGAAGVYNRKPRFCGDLCGLRAILCNRYANPGPRTPHSDSYFFRLLVPVCGSRPMEKIGVTRNQKGSTMSGIVLTASVRQNLLSLQSTADLLSTTQNRLATGNMVNSALDNPTNFFTAQGLNNRANDINNLLDSIGNGVQVLQGANTGITSLQKLVDTAKSIANQVLQAPTGYSVKSSATTAAPTGATPALLAAGTASDLTNAGTNGLNGQTFVFTPAAGAATTITVSSTVAAGNVNSIDAFNAALSSAGIGLTAALASNGSIGFTSTNDNASQALTLGT